MCHGINCLRNYRHICAEGIGGVTMMLNLGKWAVCFGLVIALCLSSYFLGRSHSEIKIIKERGKEIIKEVEVIKYVEREKAKIWSAPNAGRDDLLKLMQNGKL